VPGQPETSPIVGRARIANLANILTGLRLVLVPIFMFALFYEGGHEVAGRIVAFVIFAIACVTDRLDGLLARNYGMATEFGAFVDPIADKALIGSALIGLSILGDLPWWVTVLIVTREVGVTLLRLAVIRRGVIPASWGGKLKTVVQALAIGLFVLPWAEASGPFLMVASVVMAVAIVLTVLTGIDYVASTAREVRQTGNRSAADQGESPNAGRDFVAIEREPTPPPPALT
jgi:CDP-diacylglycerol--glycerol-3-phosphate 3-phosphatidyltransferase